MKKHLSTIFLIVIFVIGMSLLLYPTFANWYNQHLYRDRINEYEHIINSVDNSEIDNIFDIAYKYNENISEIGNRFELNESEMEEYRKTLSLNDSEVIGYIRIPLLNETYPIYHGTSEAVLSAGIGHLEGTSLPIGGPNSHSVLSGHRGLPSSRLFTDLDKINEGDYFVIDVLGRNFTYMVDQIKIVLPYETEDLKIIEDKDYCTLVTCTPYGINTHRLLVRGVRVENIKDYSDIKVAGEATRVEPLVVGTLIAAPVLFVLMVIVLISPKRRK